MNMAVTVIMWMLMLMLVIVMVMVLIIVVVVVMLMVVVVFMAVVMAVVMRMVVVVGVSQTGMMGMALAGSVFVSVRTATQAVPQQKKEPGEHQNGADDMALLSIYFALKLQTNHGDNPTQHQRSQHVSQRGQEGYASNAQKTPALRSRHNCQRYPVIRQNGMKNSHHTSGANQ
jgi:ABC-type multidrug transport system fused ATPase/permease subunit